MQKPVDYSGQSFWGALTNFAQGGRYHAAWEGGVFVVRPIGARDWRIVILDDPKHAFVHIEIHLEHGQGAWPRVTEGYYLPGLSPSIAERVIDQCVLEAGLTQAGGK